MTSIGLSSEIPDYSTLDRGTYSIIRKLTVSGTSNVGIALVRRRSDGQVLIRKTVSKLQPDETQLELKSHRFLSQANHPNIVKIEAVYLLRAAGRDSSDTGVMFMELCDLGTLSDFFGRLEKPGTNGLADNGTWCEAFVWHVLRSILNALVQCHTGHGSIDEFIANSGQRKSEWLPIMHTDVQGDNIFIKSSADPSSYPYILLGDFGESEIVEDFTGPLWERYVADILALDVKNLLSMLRQYTSSLGFFDGFSVELKDMLLDRGIVTDLLDFQLKDVVTRMLSLQSRLNIPYRPIPSSALVPI